jgi:hypothetical protein
MSIVNLLRNAYTVARPALRSTAVDTITNPQTYIGLADDVTNTLGRMLPKGFQGAGIQRAPMNLLGQVDDIANMSSGPARELARNQTARNFKMADRLGDAVRPVGQGPTGALRAPNVGAKAPRPTVPAGAPATQLPQVGGPLARDYGLGRSSGAVNEMAKVRNLLSQTPTQAKGLLKGLSKGTIATNLLGGGIDITSRLNAGENPVDAVGRTIFGTAGGLAGGFGAGALGIPSGPGAIAAGLAGSGAGYAAGSNAYDFLKQELFPTVPQEIIDIRNKRLAKETKKEGTYGSIPPSVNDGLPGQKYDPSVTLPGAPTVSNPIYGSIPPSVNTKLDAYDPSVTLPGGRRNVVVEDPATDVPPDPDTNYNLPNPTPAVEVPKPEIGAAMDPYAYQLNVYGQGRQASSTQSSAAAVRDLGLSIHRQMFPQFYNDDVPKTPVQVPTTMNTADALSELNSSTKAVEELLDPTILAQLTAMNLRRTGY